MQLATVTTWRLSPRAYRQVTVWTAVLVGFIIVTGATVRLTGSGLGCPQWPTCEGGRLVAPASYHPMVEWLNRVVTALVSAAVMVAALGAFVRRPRRADLCWLALGLVGGLVGQIVLGGETVKHRLEPAFVMAHLLLSMLLLWDAVLLHHRAAQPDGAPRRPLVGPDLVRGGRVLVAMVAVTVVAGTVVTGAGPHSGANAADGRVRRWHLSLHRVTQVHGTAAMLTLALVLLTFWLLHSRRAPGLARQRLQLLVEALAAQLAIGYTQYFAGVPPLLVAVHVLGATLVWAAALRYALALSSLGAAPTDVELGGRAAARSRSPLSV